MLRIHESASEDTPGNVRRMLGNATNSTVVSSETTNTASAAIARVFHAAARVRLGMTATGSVVAVVLMFLLASCVIVQIYVYTYKCEVSSTGAVFPSGQSEVTRRPTWKSRLFNVYTQHRISA